ncbi:hypothetical protein A4R44_03850 [Amycolatopsis sp. M39]|nr:hypothetical protein A4R44_03850 [Amycolatopsis sp. M39]
MASSSAEPPKARSCTAQRDGPRTETSSPPGFSFRIGTIPIPAAKARNVSTTTGSASVVAITSAMMNLHTSYVVDVIRRWIERERPAGPARGGFR